MKVQFQNPYDYKPEKPVVNEEPSMTEPNQVMPLRELLIRYANGQPINIPHVDSTYTEDYVKDLNAFNVLRERGLELADAEKVYKQLRSMRANERERMSKASVAKQPKEQTQVSENQETNS